jgi:hypothetical protein
MVMLATSPAPDEFLMIDPSMDSELEQYFGEKPKSIIELATIISPLAILFFERHQLI